MPLDKKYLLNKASISMTVHQDESILEYVYHKYASIMYGIIFKMTEDKTIAEEIFKTVFVELTEKKVISEIHPNLCMKLLRHTYELTLKHLKARGLTPINAQPFNENYPLISQFCFEQTSLKEVALGLNMSEPEMLQKLRAEFNQLRNLPPENVGIM